MTDAPVPFHYHIDPEAGLAYARMWGRVTGQDMIRLVTSVHGDPAWQPGFDAIWDCSDVSAHVVAPEEMPPLVQSEAESGSGRDVLVENPSLTDSAISHLLATLCQRRGKDVVVRRSLDDALAAVGRAALPASLAV